MSRQLTQAARLRSRLRALAAVTFVSALIGPALAIAQTTPPAGGANASTTGVFGAPIPWPINGLHSLVLPTGKVMSYGTNEKGQQGGQFNYDIWDPSQGISLAAHMLLPNTTATDTFCSGQAIMPTTGEVLITGGDQTKSGKRNYSTNETVIFSETPSPDLRPASAMTYARWYPSVVTMPDGTMVAIGGRADQYPDVPVLTQERYTPGAGWHLLTGASSPDLFRRNWYYPRAFVAPNGLIFMLDNSGAMYYLDPRGDGSISKIPGVSTVQGPRTVPTLMFTPGKILSLRAGLQAVVIDLNGPTPVVAPVANTDQVRMWANLTVMADGKVLMNGGSAENNKMVDVAYTSQIWNPATGQWTPGATAQKARLYHSIALLLPDGSVLTGAGGAPGPVNNLNGEIYYPPYLYKKDGSGQPALRPAFNTNWSAAKLGETKGLAIRLSGGQLVDTLKRVTLVRLGSVTHTYNSEQRLLDVNFTPVGTSNRDYELTLPNDPNRAVPGYYMLFAFNQDGVPSVAKIIRLTI